MKKNSLRHKKTLAPPIKLGTLGGALSQNCLTKSKNQHKVRKARFYIATFNAQSLSSDSYMAEFEEALSKINYDVIGLSEIKRIGESTEERKDFIFYYYGITRKRATIGFVIKKKWKNNIKSIKAYSDRVALLIMEIKRKQFAFIQCYAPTSASSDEEIDSFYEKLDAALADTNNCDHTFVLGDFNAKVG